MAEEHPVQHNRSQNAGDVMTTHPTCCTPETPLERVAQLMVLQDCGEIPVIENEDAPVLVGVVTDRDIVCRVIAKGKNPLEHTAESCMSQPAVSVAEHSSMEEVLRALEEHQVRRVPVVNARNECVGIISQADLAWSGSNKEVAQLVREVSRDSNDASR